MERLPYGGQTTHTRQRWVVLAARDCFYRHGRRIGSLEKFRDQGRCDSELGIAVRDGENNPVPSAHFVASCSPR